MDNSEKKVNPWLILGILLAPYIFYWALLKKGYSTQARLIGLGWLFFIVPQLLIIITEPSTEIKSQEIDSPSSETVVLQNENSNKTCDIYLNMLADDVLNKLGKSISRKKIGEDSNGLIVEWVYPECIFTMKLSALNGVEAYRVSLAIDATKTKVSPIKSTTSLPTPKMDAIDCVDLSVYAKAKGHGFFERAMIVNEARKAGNCR